MSPLPTSSYYPHNYTGHSNHDRKFLFENITTVTPYLLYDDDDYEDILKKVLEQPTTTTTVAAATTTANLIRNKSNLSSLEDSTMSLLDVEQLDSLIDQLENTISKSSSKVPTTKFHNLIDYIDDCPSPSPPSPLPPPQRQKHLDKEYLKKLIIDLQPRQSKWFDPNRPGQAELYDSLEKVLLQLKNFIPHSIPFLHRVNRKEVPDYYDVIRKPMDLGTMMKKLKSFSYLNRSQFIADLELIHSNCFTYNSDPESPFRKHMILLKERWQTLMMSVPDIVVEPFFVNGKVESSNLDLDLEVIPDDLEVLIDANLEKLVAEDEYLTTQSQKAEESPSTPPPPPRLPLSQSESIIDLESSLSFLFPNRNPFLMSQYLKKYKTCKYPELEFFHQFIPDPYSVNFQLGDPQEYTIDKALRDRCEHFRSIRALISEISGNPSSAIFVENNPLPESVTILPSKSQTPKLAFDTLSSLLSWILFGAGFEGFQRSALSLFTDVVSSFVQRACQNLNLYLDVREDPKTFPRSSIYSKLVTDYFPAGPVKFVKELKETPKLINDRFKRVLFLLQERKLSSTSITINDDSFLSDGGGNGQIAEDEVDLGFATTTVDWNVKDDVISDGSEISAVGDDDDDEGMVSDTLSSIIKRKHQPHPITDTTTKRLRIEKSNLQAEN